MKNVREIIPVVGKDYLAYRSRNVVPHGNELSYKPSQAAEHPDQLVYKSDSPGRVNIRFNLDPLASFEYTTSRGSICAVGYWIDNPSFQLGNWIDPQKSLDGIYLIRNIGGGTSISIGMDYEIWKKYWNNNHGFRIHLAEIVDQSFLEWYKDRNEWYKSQGLESPYPDEYPGMKLVCFANQAHGGFVYKENISPTLRVSEDQYPIANISDAAITINFNEKGELVSLT